MLAGKKTNESKSGTGANAESATAAVASTADKPNAATESTEPNKTDQPEKDLTSTPSVTSAAASGSNASNNQMFRALKGVMRVGLLAKGLLLKGDTDVQLIVLCADKPNKRLLERVFNILAQKIDIVSPQIKYSVILDKQAETIVIVKTTINDLQPLITCKVLLTSPAVRTTSEQLADQAAEVAAANSAGDKPAETALKSGFYFKSYSYKLFKQFEIQTVFFFFIFLKTNINMNLLFVFVNIIKLIITNPFKNYS